MANCPPPVVTTHRISQVRDHVNTAFSNFQNSMGTAYDYKSLINTLTNEAGGVPYGRRKLFPGLISDVKTLTPASARQLNTKVIGHINDYINSGVKSGLFTKQNSGISKQDAQAVGEFLDGLQSSPYANP